MAGLNCSMESMEKQVGELTARLAGLDADLQDKKALVNMVGLLDGLCAEPVASEYPRLTRLAEWLDKLLTSVLLDQVRDAPAAVPLIKGFVGLIRRSLAGADEEEGEGQEEGLIARAAGLMGLPSPGPAPGAAPSEALPREPSAPAVPGEGDPPGAGDVRAGGEGEAPGGGGDAPGGEGSPPPWPEAEALDFTGAMFEEAFIFDFIDEGDAQLAEVEGKILALESDPGNQELVNEIFRPVHNIKGSSGFLGVRVVQDLAHEAENLLDEVRKGRMAVTPPLVEVLLEATDILRTMLAQLRTVANRETGRAPAGGEALPLVPLGWVRAAIRALAAGRRPPPKGAAPGGGRPVERLGQILLSEGAIDEDQLEQALSLQERPLGKVLVEEGIVSSERVNAALERQQTVSKGTRGVIKVDIEKLDEMVNLVGELVIAQTLVLGRAPDDGEGGSAPAGLRKDMETMGKIIKEIQDRIMSLRMVPLQPVFQKMLRVVRDVAQKSGKKADLEISGGETELDKTVSEAINDPLVHIIRNAVDHGLETPEERLAAGKKASGRVRLSACQEGGSIVIEVSDDGKGLNREKILQRGIERGLVAEGAALSPAEACQLIMSPGFSTADRITDISGRGVGLDVVRKHIEQLRGKVELVSTEGQGTTLVIRLPLTLAIIDGMVVRVGAERYVVPTLLIVRSLRARPEELCSVQGRGEMLNIHGELLPLIRLHEVFSVEGAETRAREGILVVVESERGRYALLVDELIGQQQVVIKGLGPFFGGAGGVSGGAILGDGKVGLILELDGVYEIYRGEGAPPGWAHPAAREAARS